MAIKMNEKVMVRYDAIRPLKWFHTHFAPKPSLRFEVVALGVMLLTIKLVGVVGLIAITDSLYHHIDC
jgi:hypothetical protein